VISLHVSRFTFYDSSEKAWNRQRIERIKLILFHCYPLHLLNPLMGFDLFSVESFYFIYFTREIVQ